MEFFNELKIAFMTIKITDIIDVLVMTFIIYKVIMLVRETRAAQLLKGLFLILIFSRISILLNLYTVNWLISSVFTVGMVLIIVVFQPELRRAFEKLGRSNSIFTSIVKLKVQQINFKTEEIVNAVASLSRQKIGALIVIENGVGLADIVETGTILNSEISSELIINLFFPKSPLHDGAVIIKDEKIVAAGCFLPLSSNNSLSKELGTRHRAALGMSEKSDAFIIVVSEETGIITTVQNSSISRHIDSETLKNTLNKLFADSDNTIFKKITSGDENGNN
ncbi:diadenylate cyclase CdaA [Helcococcus ovis]|uniref:diadenylate cyclase CdaA n=1 Tax=Helcococcus TaxID=31983 RepID=UPI001FD6D18B|nr:diadenylate cyclase CdaA [Helcococcus ovis]